MLDERGFSNTRLWPRGVDLDVFTPTRRSRHIRELYGVDYPETENEMKPESNPSTIPQGISSPPTVRGGAYPSDGNVVILSVGRMYLLPIYLSHAVLIYVASSYEKNLVLLVHAFAFLIGRIPPGTPKPRLVFVGKSCFQSNMTAN
jgi:glycosyltransferase involved in cell wall biosynthesis